MPDHCGLSQNTFHDTSMICSVSTKLVMTGTHLSDTGVWPFPVRKIAQQEHMSHRSGLAVRR